MSEKTENPKCKDCMCFVPDAPNGTCRYNPPTGTLRSDPVHHHDNIYHWPRVEEYEFCGFWRSKESGMQWQAVLRQRWYEKSLQAEKEQLIHCLRNLEVNSHDIRKLVSFELAEEIFAD